MTPLVDRNVFVVRQKAKIIEMNNEYAILDGERAADRQGPPRRLLIVGAAAAIDTALKQDDTGGWGFGGIDL